MEKEQLKINFRRGNINDCEAVYRLICEMESKQLPFDRFSKIYRNQLKDRHYHCLVCEMDNQVIGVLNLRLEEQLHHAECVAEIMEFSIDAAYQNQGIGKAAFVNVCQIAKDSGCTQIEVACNQLRTDTHRFYLREDMYNFHYKFSKQLVGENMPENKIGR